MAREVHVRYTECVTEPAAPPKKDVASALLLRGSVFVHLDPRVDGVRVPEWLRQQPQLVLQIGLDMPIPIPDLRVDADGVYGTLSFQQRPFLCTVQWKAVFALVGEDGRGMVWPEDLPAEIAAEVDREAAADNMETKAEKRRPTPRERPALSVVRGEPEEPPVTETGKRRAALPPYLRVIK